MPTPSSRAPDRLPLTDRVAAGAARLNSRDGGRPDWWTRIDDQFDMRSFRTDVLAQVYGTYGQGLSELGITTYEDEVRYGFDAGPDELDALHALWATEIARRSHPAHDASRVA